MRGISSLPLDDDITDRILMFLPDFTTLQATILASKSFYTVFQAHPNSIIRAISYNVTGPALPQAIRLIRYERPDENNSDMEADSNEPFKVSPNPWGEETTAISPISMEEAQSLLKNAFVVNALEDIFSMRHKDRSSQSSKLTFVESWRFRRAMYRITLFTRIFPCSEADNDDDDDDDDNDHEEVAARNAWLKHKKFFSEFDTTELRELHTVVEFLVETLKWVETASDANWDQYNGTYTWHVALSTGPEEILEAYQSLSLDSIEGMLGDVMGDSMPGRLNQYIAYPLSKIWERRKVKPPAEDESHWKSILDEVIGEHDICIQCNTICGLKLFNQTNWDALNGLESTRKCSLAQLLKGKLSQNPADGASLLSTQLYNTNFSYPVMMQEIFDRKTSSFGTWSQEDWICETCVDHLLRAHLHLWLLDRKQQAGQQIPEDCWYGYDCRTQTHSYHHAKRVNHFCEPTR